MRRKAVLFGLALLAVAAGAAAVVYWRGRPSEAAKAAPAETPASSETVFAAVVRARNIIDVPAPVEGTLEELLVEPGQPVYEGQLIARIRNTALSADQERATRDAASAEERLNRFEGELTALRLEHSRARAELSRVQGEFDRIDKLFQREQMLLREGATPRKKFEAVDQEYQQRRADRDAAEASAQAAEERVTAMQKRVDATRSEREAKNQELEAAREHAAAGEVHSPADGLLLATARGAGEEVPAGTPDLLRIAVNLSDLEALLEPPPPVLARVRPGTEALVMFAEAGDSLQGRVREIQGTQIVIEFASPNPAIKPGMNAQVRLNLEPVPAAQTKSK